MQGRAKKLRRVYVCQDCGRTESKWMGRCSSCNAWSSFVEELVQGATPGAATAKAGSAAVPLAAVNPDAGQRLSTGIVELDRVLGGGLVKGALTLVGGDPGIGKSTLLLQAFGALGAQGVKTLYASGEESLGQIKLRADRLGIAASDLYVIGETTYEAIDEARRGVQPRVMVVDSIQTVSCELVESPVGSVSQIRAITHLLMELAKGQGVSIFVVGHVTKEGTIAGPKVMEHMVDTVLYFEGERTGPYRILRAHKNRFGSAQEIGIFEMHGDGLRAVANPSELFLSQRAEGPGAAVITCIEGSRPILLEVQALTTPCLYGNPRRNTVGFDPGRTAMLCAVLESRVGAGINGLDVYVNVAGGVKVCEPAADLGVVTALASTMRGVPLPHDTVVGGEVGLSGEVRGISQLRTRVQEAHSLGFKRCVVPKIDVDRWTGSPPAIALRGVATIAEALDVLGL